MALAVNDDADPKMLGCSWRSGSWHFEWDSTLGFPGEGPVPIQEALEHLRSDTGVAPLSRNLALLAGETAHYSTSGDA